MKKIVILIMAAAAIAILQTAVGHRPGITKQELGRMLFFDPILSSDSTTSCASCHIPAYAFADTAAVSKGIGGRTGTRNTPTAMNLLLQQAFFWDGRAKTLEEQALAPIENPDEMDLPVEQALLRLEESPLYRDYFRKVFNTGPDRTSLAAAIAAFERSLETSDSPFDDWKFTGNPGAVSEAVKRGFVIFSEKGKCSQCHFGANFTNSGFRNVGLFDGKKLNDSGRITITGIPADLGRFKVPSLRNIALTAPYMHNGMFKTLEEVITFYNDPAAVVLGSQNRDSLLLRPLGLTEQEKEDLLAFMLALTDKQFAGAIKK